MYTPDDYDEYSCLKPSLGIYFAIIFLMKDVVLIILEALSKIAIKGGPANSLAYFKDLVQPEMILVNIIGLLLFLSFKKRVPQEQGFWKKISSKGKFLMMMAFSLHLAILGIEQYLQMSEAYRWSKGISLPLVIMIIVDAIFLSYVATARRIKDVFSDWPEAEQP